MKSRKPPTSAIVLISGSGTNLQSFIDAVQAGTLAIDLAAVISNQPNAGGLRRAEQAGIPQYCIASSSFPDRDSYDAALSEHIRPFKPDLLILAGFMRILSPGFVAQFQGRLLNIHPSLLPAYPGLHTHQRVLDAGERQHGATVHFVTAALDAGPRILQAVVPVHADDDVSTLSARVQAKEHIIYPVVAGWFASGRLRFDAGRALLDGHWLERPLRLDDIAETELAPC